MTSHRKLASVAAIAATLLIPAAAHASGGETPHHVMLSQFAINNQTCRFAFPEVDPMTGPTWLDLRAYVLYEDARHDAKLRCLTSHLGTVKAGPRGPQGPTGPAGVSGYTRVAAPIDTAKLAASATCPTGDVVIGGGATIEVAGSYPSTDSTWTVTRDAAWAHTTSGTVYAICAKAAQ